MTTDAACARPFSLRPFDLEDDTGYRTWRNRKLESRPICLQDLIVEVRDPRQLSPAEHAALLERCGRANMAIYAGRTGDDPDKGIPEALGRQFGLVHIDHNWLADYDAITPLTVHSTGDRPGYIPYTNRPIKWHTDGYYNSAARQIRSLILHCVHPAQSGGENALLDHELAYICLRDANPDYVRALMQPDVMTIPAREEEGEVVREAETGPVFSLDASGDLHMRYTARRRNILWKDQPTVKAAVSFLDNLLEKGTYALRGRLESGMGLLCNNVLHDRAGFTDDEQGPHRLLYRARYYDRIRGTALGDIYPQP